MVSKAVIAGASTSLTLRSVVRIFCPDTDRDNGALRGRRKRGARLRLRSTRLRGLLHEVDRACAYVGVPVCINPSGFELDRDEERFHTSPSSVAGRSLCVRSVSPAVVQNSVPTPHMRHRSLLPPRARGGSSPHGSGCPRTHPDAAPTQNYPLTAQNATCPLPMRPVSYACVGTAAATVLAGACMGLALRRARWWRPWRRGDNAGPWGHHPGHHIPFGVHTLDIGSVILCLEQPPRGCLLWDDPELLPRIGPALALLRLEHVHGLADR